MEKKDVRIVKTRQSLVSAMGTLLERQDLGSITVNDICAQAMVSRSTFYSHFDDKYDLLRFCMEQMSRTLFEHSETLSGVERIALVLTRIKENSRVFKNLLMANPDRYLIDILQRNFLEMVRERFERSGLNEADLPGPLDIITTFYASGITNAAVSWVAGNMAYSVEEMAKCLYALAPMPLGGC